jgi:inosose dehydratase
VNTVARYARERGLVTAFHPHVASYIERPEEIARLMRDTDPTLVGLCLDTGHVAYGGGDPVEIARTHAQRVRHVHLKDVRREVRADALARHLDFRDAVSLGVFAPLGDGSLDLRSTLSALRAVGYAGWLIVEQDVRLGVSPIAAPLRDAKRSRAYLTDGARGVTVDAYVLGRVGADLYPLQLNTPLEEVRTFEALRRWIRRATSRPASRGSVYARASSPA